MCRISRVFLVLALAALTALSLTNQSAFAQTIWSGLTKSFTKASFSDYTLPRNQDELTPNVVLTRGDSGGLINYEAESSYVISISPALTTWATDLNNPGETIAATNFASLAFTNWLDAYGGPGSHGSFIAGRSAVVHLTADDVYLDLKFTSWTPSGGGGYAYMRAEPPVPPTTTGDYNHNNAVDAGDYVIWRRTFGNSAIPSGSGADGNSNGTIDQGDYTFWRERFGNAPVGAGAGLASIPEPRLIPLSLQLVVATICTLRWRSAARGGKP
jgi:hypothetical protein